MAQNRKKGKQLSTKCSNDKITKNFCKNDLNYLDESFLSLSEKKQEDNKDDSLIIFETSTKNRLIPTNKKDIFEFPLKDDTLKSECTYNEETIPNNSFNRFCFKRGNNQGGNDDLLISKRESGVDEKKVHKITHKSSIENKKTHTNTTLDDDVLIPSVAANKNVVQMSEIPIHLPQNLGAETVNQCPICLKTVAKYVEHMKSCAAKQKLSTQQLLDALKLHKKQIAERKELGLGLPVQSFQAKISPKKSRNSNKKGPIDTSLQLALALSASLHSAEENEVIEEAEALKQAGLSEEAEQKLSTLEKYGFASALPPGHKIVQGHSKSRQLTSSLLQTRTKEERERIITEKVAIILISGEDNIVLDTYKEYKPVIKSNLLIDEWDQETQLWSKANYSGEEEQAVFYVKALSQFVSPRKGDIGSGLRRLSQLPGRLNTPEKTDISELLTPPRLSISNRIDDGLSFSNSTIQYNSISSKKHKLSQDWSLLVNNPTMSDIDVCCRGGLIVHAHKLVLHVRCPTILNEALTSENHRDVIKWRDCSKNAVIAFLEFVYTENLDNIFNLADEDLQCLVHLIHKLNYSELKSHLRTLIKNSEKINKGESKEDVKQKLFQTSFDKESEVNITDKSCPYDNSSCNSSGSGQLPQSNCCDLSSNGRGSPDMFGESNVMENEYITKESQDDLDILASLVGRTTDNESKIDNLDNLCKKSKRSVTNSSNRSSVNEFTSTKRKATDTSISEDEGTSHPKKVCSDLLQSELLGDVNEELSFNSEKNSDSSIEEVIVDSNKISEVDIIPLNITSKKEDDYYLNDLTPKKTSVASSPLQELGSHNKIEEARNDNECQDYIDPIWAGFDDDYLHYNYEYKTPSKTPRQSLEQSSRIRTYLNSPPSLENHIKISSSPSTRHSTQNSSDWITPKRMSQVTLSPSYQSSPNIIKCMSSGNNSMKTNVQKQSRQSPNLKYISPDSKYPKKMLQNTLDDYSPQININKEDDHNIVNSVELRENVSFEEIISISPKSRKNLSSDFDISFNEVNPIEKLTTVCKDKSPKISQRKMLHSSLKKDSLTAIQRLLDDSLEVSDSVFSTADALLAAEVQDERAKRELKNLSEPSKTNSISNYNEKTSSLMTPSPEIIVCDNVTPLPDYSAMKTPSLKKELSRFGLKPSLGRRKAKMLLRHIYDQTHPLIPTNSAELGTPTFDFKKPEGQPPRSPVKSPRGTQLEVNLVDSDSDSDEPCSQQSTSSSSSSIVTLPEESFCEPDEILSQNLSTTGEIKASIRNLILSNADLHRKVLQYEPIFIEEFMVMLKANGIKSKANDIMDFLDEQCITFRTTNWKATNEKRKLKQRSPKKKTKHTNGSNISNPQEVTPHSFSPLKSQSKIIKKRGRPKKKQ